MSRFSDFCRKAGYLYIHMELIFLDIDGILTEPWKNAQSKANSELLRWRVQLESELDIRPMAEYNGEPRSFG